MPALPNAPGCLRIAVSGTGVGASLWLSRFYINYSGTAPTTAQLATFDTAVDSAFNTNLVPLMDTDHTATQIETTDLTSPTGAVDIKAIARVGSRAGSALPAQICTVCSYSISRRYRGGHPRGYWPFAVVGDLATPRTWTGAFVTAVNSGMAAFITAVKAAGWTGAGTLTQVNVSYYSGFSVVTNPITHRARNVPTLRVSPTIDTVTGVNTRLSIGTQRRREAFVA